MDELMVFPCPACGAQLRAPHDSAGRQGKCNKCQKAFIVPAQFAMDDAPPAASPASASAPPAMINPFQRLPPPPKPKPGAMDLVRSLAPPVLGVVVLGVGGWFAWSYFTAEDKPEKPAAGAEADAAAAAADQERHRRETEKAEADRKQAAAEQERKKLAQEQAKREADAAAAKAAAAPPAAPTPSAPVAAAPAAAPVPAISQKEAEQLVRVGKVAMQESNDHPSRSVDAAVAFSKAIAYYEAAGEVDKVCDLEANIFWCKKRMNVDDVKAFMAAKAGDHSVEQALAKADAVATKEIPKSEAKNYLERADRFASEHPDDLEQISVRYFEVAERFVGTDIALNAQKLSLAAQQKQLRQFQAEKDAQRQTLFTKPADGAAPGVQLAALPGADAQKTAVASVRKIYKDDYAKAKPNQRRRLIAKLLDQVPGSKDDPATQYALLNEAIELSVGVADWYSVFIACDEMAKYFKGVDAKAKKKEVYGKVRPAPAVQAILKLLDNPEDADANAVVGKYFCFEGGKWSLGLPLLAHGNDATYKAAAEMELLRPASTAQQIELADKWYELGKKARPGARESLLARAFTWYKQAEPTISGITKQRVVQRIDEIDGLLPMTNVDYDNLTPKQWDHLKGATVEVLAGKDRNDIGISISRGQRVRVVPHPTDTWVSDYFSTPLTITWKGATNSGLLISSYGFGDFPIGAMVMQIEQGKVAKPGILEGEGRIFLGPYAAGWGSGGSGKIRCKILPVTDDDGD